MSDQHCEIIYGDDGEPIARVQLGAEPTDEEREAIDAIIRAVLDRMAKEDA